MAEQRGASLPVMAVGLVSSATTAILAVWVGALLGSTMSDSAERMLTAIALLLVAFELCWWRTPRKAHEPTQSLGALAIVLLARQIGDAPRLILFALAAGSAAPALTGAGGAFGAAAGMTLAVSVGRERLVALPLRAMRLGLGAVAGVLAIIIGLSVRGLIG